MDLHYNEKSTLIRDRVNNKHIEPHKHYSILEIIQSNERSHVYLIDVECVNYILKIIYDHPKKREKLEKINLLRRISDMGRKRSVPHFVQLYHHSFSIGARLNDKVGIIDTGIWKLFMNPCKNDIRKKLLKLQRPPSVEHDSGSKLNADKSKDTLFASITVQLFMAIYAMNVHGGVMHQDMYMRNVLVDDVNDAWYEYTFGDHTIRIFNAGIHVRICDFDISCDMSNVCKIGKEGTLYLMLKYTIWSGMSVTHSKFFNIGSYFVDSATVLWELNKYLIKANLKESSIYQWIHDMHQIIVVCEKEANTPASLRKFIVESITKLGGNSKNHNISELLGHPKIETLVEDIKIIILRTT
jgi:hypothetical protein